VKARDGAGYVAVALFAAPVVVGGLYSLAATVGVTGAGADGFGVARIARVLGDGGTWRSIAWTLATSLVATAVATLAALSLAVSLRRSRVARRLVAVPLAVPHAAAALAMLLLLGQSGFLSRVAFAVGVVSQPTAFPALVYDRAGFGLVVAFAWKEFPFLVLTAWAVLDAAGEELHEVAQTLGANANAIFRRITWPLLWRGVAPAVVAVFAFLIGQYEMAVVLAPSDPLPLSMLTYERALDPELQRRGEAHLLGLIALLLSAGLVIFHERLRAGVTRLSENDLQHPSSLQGPSDLAASHRA
jgi:putative spermidine/putrescine transport system permease protein